MICRSQTVNPDHDDMRGGGGAEHAADGTETVDQPQRDGSAPKFNQNLCLGHGDDHLPRRKPLQQYNILLIREILYDVITIPPGVHVGISPGSPSEEVVPRSTHQSVRSHIALEVVISVFTPQHVIPHPPNDDVIARATAEEVSPPASLNCIALW